MSSMTLRRNDLRRRITPAAARASCYTLTRALEKCPADLAPTLLVEAGEAWASPRPNGYVQFYLDGATVRYRIVYK